jgi:hypothetical protein
LHMHFGRECRRGRCVQEVGGDTVQDNTPTKVALAQDFEQLQQTDFFCPVVDRSVPEVFLQVPLYGLEVPAKKAVRSTERLSGRGWNQGEEVSPKKSLQSC